MGTAEARPESLLALELWPLWFVRQRRVVLCSWSEVQQGQGHALFRFQLTEQPSGHLRGSRVSVSVHTPGWVTGLGGAGMRRAWEQKSHA